MTLYVHLHFSLIPCNTYRIALGWRHLLHQKSLRHDWSTQISQIFPLLFIIFIFISRLRLSSHSFPPISLLIFSKKFPWSITKRRWKQTKSITKPSRIIICVLVNIGLQGYIWSIQYSYVTLISLTVNPDFNGIVTYCIKFIQWNGDL